MASEEFDLSIPTGLDDLLAEQTERNQIVGSWGFNPRIDFTRMNAEETNVWFFEQVFNFLRSFFGVVMPDNMELITYNGGKQIKRENLNQMTFLDELMLIMKGLSEQIWVIRLNLNIVGFLRTEFQPDLPAKVTRGALAEKLFERFNLISHEFFYIPKFHIESMFEDKFFRSYIIKIYKAFQNQILI